jgi:hypothetical protein
MGPSVIVSVVHKLDIDESIMGAWKAGVCALLHVLLRFKIVVCRALKCEMKKKCQTRGSHQYNGTEAGLERVSRNETR